MANTSAVYARIDTGVKESAENILHQLGISPSAAIQMFYRQIIINQGIPFDLRLPANRPAAIGGMNASEVDAEIAKGLDSLKTGKGYSAEEVDAMLAEEFGIA